MDIVYKDNGDLLIRHIDAFFADLLRKIPAAADPSGHHEACERIFSKPIKKDADPEFLEEWGAYVTPDLRDRFDQAKETVAADLRRLVEENQGEKQVIHEKPWSIVIPENHFDQWLNNLNQTRLVLAARNNFTEDDMDSVVPHIIEKERDLHLLQIHFYGYIQEVILQVMK